MKKTHSDDLLEIPVGGELTWYKAFDELDKMKQEVAKLLDVPERYMTDQKEHNRSSIV